MTTRPVTQVEVVAVNSAVMKFVGCPVLEETGRVSTNAPMRIISAKPKAMT
jgi:hypothetical protein